MTNEPLECLICHKPITDTIATHGTSDVNTVFQLHRKCLDEAERGQYYSQTHTWKDKPKDPRIVALCFWVRDPINWSAFVDKLKEIT